MTTISKDGKTQDATEASFNASRVGTGYALQRRDTSKDNSWRTLNYYGSYKFQKRMAIHRRIDLEFTEAIKTNPTVEYRVIAVRV